MSHPPSCAHARKDAGRKGRTTNRTRRAMEHRTVSRRAPTEMMTLNHTRKSFSFADSDHIHFLFCTKHVYFETMTGFQFLLLIQKSEFSELTERRDTRLIKVTTHGF